MPENEFAEEQSNILALYKIEIEKQQILQKRHSKEIDDHRVVVENAKKKQAEDQIETDRANYERARMEHQRKESLETMATRKLVKQMEDSINTTSFQQSVASVLGKYQSNFNLFIYFNYLFSEATHSRHT